MGKQNKSIKQQTVKVIKVRIVLFGLEDE